MLLEIKNLNVEFKQKNSKIIALKNISLKLNENEILGVVGESGSGKSTLCLSILRLLPPNAIITGEVYYQGKNLLNLTEKEMQRIRGKHITMIFQNPVGSLFPLKRIGDQILEVLNLHQPRNGKENKEILKQEAIHLLNQVLFLEPEKRFNDYPHQLSGGMAQKVAIAKALACKPKILLADEPTSSLDATAEQEIIYLLKKIKKEQNISILFISHNLSTVAQLCDRIIVMHNGEIVEENTTEKIFTQPQHPYTKMLIRSLPILDQNLTKLIQNKNSGD